MKILYGITKSNFGGAQRYVFDLAKAMKEQGHDVTVLCGGNGILIEKLKEAGIRVISLDNLQRDISLGKEVSSFFQILKILKRERPDVFHTNSSKMGGVGNLAARLSGVKKIIFTGHAWAFNEPRSVWQKFFIKVLAWITVILSHKTICVSEKTKRDISSWPFISDKLTVIYNGIGDFPLVSRSNNIFTVGAISELHKIKGLDVLLTAWSKFKKNRESKLVIFGDGEERSNLEKMAQNMDISDSVEFKGFVNNARENLSSFDVFLMPSRSEAFPYALLEAGVANLPVIATFVGGIPEIIENGATGILVPKEDSETIFSSLVLLYEDKSLRERLGNSLKAFIKEKFSLKQMIEKTSSLYL